MKENIIKQTPTSTIKENKTENVRHKIKLTDGYETRRD